MRPCVQAVRNFVQLCLEGYYDGAIFHRVIRDFMAQTGDPTGTGEGARGAGSSSGGARAAVCGVRCQAGRACGPAAWQLG